MMSLGLETFGVIIRVLKTKVLEYCLRELYLAIKSYLKNSTKNDLNSLMHSSIVF